MPVLRIGTGDRNAGPFARKPVADRDLLSSRPGRSSLISLRICVDGVRCGARLLISTPRAIASNLSAFFRAIHSRQSPRRNLEGLGVAMMRGVRRTKPARSGCALGFDSFEIRTQAVWRVGLCSAGSRVDRKGANPPPPSQSAGGRFVWPLSNLLHQSILILTAAPRRPWRPEWRLVWAGCS